MVLIVTVNYNNALLTNEMLESIYTDNRLDVSTIIVDNASNDVEEIKLINDNCSLIKLTENIGYFPALNRGLKEVDLNKYEYIIICNNDLLFEPHFFSVLKESIYEKRVYAVCPRILDLDGIDQNPMLDKGISKFKVFFYDIYYLNYQLGQILYNIWQKVKKVRIPEIKRRQIFMGYGPIYILTKDFFKTNISLDAEQFLMFEETSLAYQIYKTGGIELFDPELIVTHRDHSSCSKITKKNMYMICKKSYKIFRKKIFKIPRIL